jgi:pimeloyl-ACP methyl ester carboxylesterase
MTLLTHAAPAAAIADAYSDFDRSQVVAEDGTALDVYECGISHGSPVVIVNPIGVPVVLPSRLMRRLGERHRVICWEQRGCRESAREFLAKPTEFQSFVSDLVRVVEVKGGKRCALIGICSGASLAIAAVANELVNVAPLVLVSPGVRFSQGYSPSIFDQAVVPYMQMIADGDRAIAESILDLNAAQAAHGEPTAADDELLVDAADRWNLRTLDSLLVYAKTVSVFAGQSMDSHLPRVRQKVFVISASDDKTVLIATVRQLTELLPHADLLEHSSGGHFLVFLNAEAQADICGIIDDSAC